MRRMARIAGRSDDMIIVRGVNLFPSQIEEQIFKVKGLRRTTKSYSPAAALDELEVLVEAAPLLAEAGARQASAAELGQRIKGVIGVTARITVTDPGSLERSRGKARGSSTNGQGSPNPLGRPARGRARIERMSTAARPCPLLAVGAVAAMRKVEMEMVAMGLVGLGAEHSGEHAAGALMQSAQELRLRGLGDVRRSRRSRRGNGFCIRRAAADLLQLRRLYRPRPVLGPRRLRAGMGDGCRQPLRLLVARGWSPGIGYLDGTAVGGHKPGNVDGVGERVFTQAIGVTVAADPVAACVARGAAQARDAGAKRLLGSGLERLLDPGVQPNHHGAVNDGRRTDLDLIGA